jgi:ribonuclease P protein component
MLSRAKRLSRADFSSVIKGKRAVSAHFSVSVNAAAEGRAAAVVSKKVAKKSVDRHLLKRRILSVAASHIAHGRSFIVYARAGSESLPYARLREELETLLRSLPTV